MKWRNLVGLGRMTTAELTQHSDIALEEMIKRVLESQHPFFTSLLNQMAAIEGRLQAQDSSIGELKQSIAVMTSAQFSLQLAKQDERIQQLEDEKNKRLGARELFEWIPKAAMWLAILVGIIVAWKLNLVRGSQ